MHVLYVDPDAGAQGAAAALPGTVDVVGSAAAARERLDGGPVDCLVTELDLPDDDGLSFVGAVADVVPVVVYTGTGSEAAAGEAVAAGAAGYVPKPDAETLAERVTAVVEEGATDRTVDPSTDAAGRPPDRASSGSLESPEPPEASESSGSPPRATAAVAEPLAALQAETSEMIRMDAREEIAAAAVGAARDVLGYPMSAVRLHDPERDVLELAAMTDEGWERVHPVDPPPIGPGDDALWRVFETGDPQVQDRMDPADSVYGADRPVESLIVQPLGEHGVLTFGADRPGAFDDADVRLAGVLATTVAAAMDRAERQQVLELYRTIVDAAGDGVFTLDADGRYQQVNDRFLELTGLDREELLGEQATGFLDAADTERAREEVARLVAGDADVVTYEVTLQPADGEPIPVEVSQSRLPGEQFQGTVGTARNITERKATEASLREHKHKIEALHAVASDLDDCDSEAAIATVAVEAAAKVLDFDECALRIREDDGLRLLASTADDVPDRRDLGGVYEETLATGESRIVSDLRAYDGSLDNPWAFRSVLSVPVGEAAVLQAVSRDPDAFDAADRELAELLASHAADAIERLQVADELRAERDRFAALFDNVPDPVVAVDHVGDELLVEDVNPAFEETFGFGRESVLGADLDDLIVPDDREAVALDLNDRASDGRVVEREVRRRTADGLRDFRLTVVPVERGERNPATFGVYTDITERKQRRKRVEVLNRVLRHDLRNGMNIIRGEAELLGDDPDADTAAHAGRIRDHADELLRLAERTRAVERTLDRDTTTTGPVDLAAVVERAADRLREQYPDAELAVETPETATVTGETLLESAVFDVMENAVVHNDRAAPSVSVTVERAGDDFVVRVEDDGPGIPEDERELLSDRQEITQLRHASGLGLWLVQWAVTHSGGDLSFADREPRGSVVTMRLPARTDPDDGLPKRSYSASGSP